MDSSKSYQGLTKGATFTRCFSVGARTYVDSCCAHRSRSILDSDLCGIRRKIRQLRSLAIPCTISHAVHHPTTHQYSFSKVKHPITPIRAAWNSRTTWIWPMIRSSNKGLGGTSWLVLWGITNEIHKNHIGSKPSGTVLATTDALHRTTTQQ